MKIYTRVTGIWNGSQYVITATEEHDFGGPVALCCGATAAQTTALNQQTAMTQQISQQAGEVFGDSSTTYKDLMNTFSPTVAAGPNQEGFSAAEKSNLDSQAITETGQAYQNAKAATGDAGSATGGGNVSSVTGGSTTATNLGIATSAAQQTSSDLSQINQADYQQGSQNYNSAVSGMENATGVFGASTSADNAATNSANGEANTANQIATQANTWVSAVTGAIGTIAGSAAKAYTGG